ncbi:hypothetical protein DB347_00795 [Opitutaceae bacterium EW11]|nr:hypothetical protein DB347_00795 [Opitutaceae bacterium EW11]
MKSLIAVVGFLFLSGASLTLAAVHEKGAEPLKISHGDEVALEDYLVPGKITVFDFSSEYCPPCRRVAPLLDRLHQDRADVAVVKIDINRPGIKKIDWDSPVAKQYQLHSIPHFKIYNESGSLTAEGDAAYETVMRWVNSKG